MNRLKFRGQTIFFLGLEDSLLARVRGWMGKQAAQVKQEAEEAPAGDKQQKKQP